MRFTRNILVYSVADLLGRSIGLITSPLMTRLLTPTQYGAMGLLGSIWSMVSLAQYGGMDAAYPFFRAHIPPEQQSEQQRLILHATWTATWSFWIVWFLFGISLLVITPVRTYAGITLWEACAYLLSLIPASLVYWRLYILRFLHQSLAFARISLLNRVVGVVLSLPLLACVIPTDRLWLFFMVNFTVGLLAMGWSWYELQRLGILQDRKNAIDYAFVKRLLKYGIVLIPGFVIYAWSAVADRMLVGFFQGPDEVAILTLTLALGSAFTLLKQWFSLVWDPHLVEWVGKYPPPEITYRLQQVSNLLCALFLSLTCLSVIWAFPVIQWLYPAYYKPVATLLPILGLSTTCSTLSLVAVATIMMSQKPAYSSFIWGTGLVLNLSVGLLLIPKHGAHGAVLANLVGEMGILVGWIFLGTRLFRNLMINWIPILAGVILTTGFVFMYPIQRVFFPDWWILEKVLLSLGVCTLIGWMGWPQIKRIQSYLAGENLHVS